MTLDIDLLRTRNGRDPEKIKESQRRRFASVELVDQVIELDDKWRELNHRTDQLKRVKNSCNKVIGTHMKTKANQDSLQDAPHTPDAELESLSDAFLQNLNVSALKSIKTQCDTAEESIEQQLKQLKHDRDTALFSIGNIVHDSVVTSNDEANNAVVRTSGDCTTTKMYSHIDLLQMIDGVDTHRGTLVAGNRGYFLKNAAVFLELAIIQLGLAVLSDSNYTPLAVPHMVKKDVMKQVAQLSEFDTQLYTVVGKASEDAADKSKATEEMYLIATSEQAIAALHRDEWLDTKALPLRYCGISSCYRQEVGSHGRDTGGIFRVHQFQKVEQFVITSPHGNESWAEMEQMIRQSEQFYEMLGIPFRVVSIVSGELNNAAAKKYDLEGWFPGSCAFRELVSCSNCLDYQSRRLKIRYSLTKKLDRKSEYVHMLNSTLCATTRTICCILENGQTDTGIAVPKALQMYMPAKYREFIPFTHPAPIDLVHEKK